MKNNKIGFLGAGRMATAIAGGMVKNSFSTSEITAFDCSAAAAKAFAGNVGIEMSADPQTMINECGTLVLAVKPQYLAEALKTLNGRLADKLIISIVAGVTLEKLGSLTGASRIIRVMPNTPALIGEGCGAYAVSPSATEDDRMLAEKILASIGGFYLLEEKMLDAVTAVSGCGPAYIYELIQAMADGGVTLGLPRDLAKKLAAATVKGAAAMVLETNTHPTELRDQVCSPGGSTICAVNHLSSKGFSGTIVEAELAAYKRSVDLGKA